MNKALDKPVAFTDGYIINIRSEEDSYGMFNIAIKREVKNGFVVQVNLNRFAEETNNVKLTNIIEKYNKDNILCGVPRDVMQELCCFFEDKKI